MVRDSDSTAVGADEVVNEDFQEFVDHCRDIANRTVVPAARWTWAALKRIGRFLVWLLLPVITSLEKKLNSADFRAIISRPTVVGGTAASVGARIGLSPQSLAIITVVVSVLVAVLTAAERYLYGVPASPATMPPLTPGPAPSAGPVPPPNPSGSVATTKPPTTV